MERRRFLLVNSDARRTRRESYHVFMGVCALDASCCFPSSIHGIKFVPSLHRFPFQSTLSRPPSPRKKSLAPPSHFLCIYRVYSRRPSNLCIFNQSLFSPHPSFNSFNSFNSLPLQDSLPDPLKKSSARFVVIVRLVNQRRSSPLSSGCWVAGVAGC